MSDYKIIAKNILSIYTQHFLASRGYRYYYLIWIDKQKNIIQEFKTMVNNGKIKFIENSRTTNIYNYNDDDYNGDDDITDTDEDDDEFINNQLLFSYYCGTTYGVKYIY